MVSSKANKNQDKSCTHVSCSVKGKLCKKKKFTESQKKPRKTAKQPMSDCKARHPPGWHHKFHYMKMGGQCGQSCPCCRAYVFLQNIDSDAKWGACQTCLQKKMM